VKLIVKIKKLGRKIIISVPEALVKKLNEV
jgi:hypothetical protein